ncbi:MAG: phage/plasmid primase, P4 family [Thermodesulfobacteriota bacterium]
MPNELLDTALLYARDGLLVFPVHGIDETGRCTCGRRSCKNPAKHPASPRGLRDATIDSSQIDTWWGNGQAHNIGIATGAGSGVFVLDVDGDEGADSLRELEATNEPLPATWTALTGRGMHLYFRLPEGFQVRNSASKIAGGLDIRGSGGYVVAPPSHHISGRHYVWEVNGNPKNVPLADSPEWLSLLLARGGGKSKKSDPKEDRPSILREGQRDDTLLRLAGGWIRKLSLEETAVLAHSWNAQYCRPPLPTAQVDKIIQQASKYRATETGSELNNAIDEIVVAGSPDERLVALDKALGLVAAQEKILQTASLKRIRKRCRDFPLADLKTRLTEVARTQLGELPVGKLFRPLPYVRRILERERVISICGDFFRWCPDLGFYAKWDPSKLTELIVSWVGDETRTAYLREIKELLADHTLKPPEQMPSRELLCIKSGVLDYESGNILPHSPDLFFTNQLPVNFDPEARSEKYNDLLDRALPEPGQQSFFEELSGYTLVRDTRFQAAFLFLDDDLGSTAKSTLAEILTRMLGPGNCEALSLSEISSRFKIAQLAAKHINVSNEVDVKAYLSDAFLKQLISGESLTVERKHRDPFVMQPHVKLIVTANRFPRSHDVGDAFFRRWKILKFRHRFPKPGEPGNIPRFAESLNEQDLDAVFLRALHGLKRIHENKRFTQPESSVAAIGEYRQAMNPLIEFAEECVVRVRGHEGDSLKHIYDVYKTWCRDTEHIPRARGKVFRQETERVLGVESAERPNGKVRYFPGVRASYTPGV